jgi:hypothetical protein
VISWLPLASALGALALTLPSGWAPQAKVSEQAWGDPADGVFGIVLTAESPQRMRAQDAIDGFRGAAAAAKIELGELDGSGPRRVGRFVRDRWRGEVRLVVGGGDRRADLYACFWTDRRPERSEADCTAFLDAAEAAAP